MSDSTTIPSEDDVFGPGEDVVLEDPTDGPVDEAAVSEQEPGLKEDLHTQISEATLAVLRSLDVYRDVIRLIDDVDPESQADVHSHVMRGLAKLTGEIGRKRQMASAFARARVTGKAPALKAAREALEAATAADAVDYVPAAERQAREVLLGEAN